MHNIQKLKKINVRGEMIFCLQILYPEILYCKGIEFLSQTLISYSYIFAFQCRRSWIFQTMNHFRSNNDSLKYQRLTPSGCKDIEIVESECVAKIHFLWNDTFKSSTL